ncbi:transposase, partial [Listeria monocytogenes]|nr:transposase [Listeria monocytogenes]
MKSKHIRNTEGVKKHAQMKSQEATQKVDKAIQHLIKTKAKINFNQVAMESGVSKAFLYNNQEIRNRIEGIRKQQEGLNTPKAIKHNMTDASKDSLIAAKNNRIKKLEEENKRLKDELLILRGMVYDK